MGTHRTPAREQLLAWIGITVAWLVWGAINTVRLHAIVHGISWETALWYGLPDALIWAALTPLIVLVTRRMAASGRSYVQTLPVHIAAALAAALLHTGSDSAVAALRRLAVGDAAHYWPIFVKLLIHALHVNVLVYFLISGFAYYLHSSRILAWRQRRTAELRAQLTEAQLTSLQMQLRPHFLFNALHTISGLMVTKPKRAQRVIRQLGELLRMSLKSGDRQTITLAEEIAFVEAYLGIERARFGERLEVELAIDEEVRDARVPALILQPLVENAVRHGVSLNPEGGLVRVEAKAHDGKLRLRVRDNGPGLPESTESDHSAGVGLTNTRARLVALYGDEHLFSIAPGVPHGVEVTIELPWTGLEALEA